MLATHRQLWDGRLSRVSATSHHIDIDMCHRTSESGSFFGSLGTKTVLTPCRDFWPCRGQRNRQMIVIAVNFVVRASGRTDRDIVPPIMARAGPRSMETFYEWLQTNLPPLEASTVAGLVA
jgi:hypothetical protein